MAKESVAQNNIWKWLVFAAVTIGAVWLAYPPREKIRLGLDLKGGNSFTLGVDYARLHDKIIESKLHDPILFGMVEGSDKLYYVADWITEEDDLTLAKVEESLGRTARKVGEASIKVDGKDVNWLIEHEKEIEDVIFTDDGNKEQK